MSDRSTVAVTIYACPPEHREAVDALLADAELVSGETYAWDEQELATDAAYAGRLSAISPQIAYEVTQEAKYEHDGRTILAVPGMGTFAAGRSPSGRVTLTYQQAMSAIVTAGAASPAVRAALDAAYGGPYLRALAALEERAEQDPPASA